MMYIKHDFQKTNERMRYDAGGLHIVWRCTKCERTCTSESDAWDCEWMNDKHHESCDFEITEKPPVFVSSCET